MFLGVYSEAIVHTFARRPNRNSLKTKFIGIPTPTLRHNLISYFLETWKMPTKFASFLDLEFKSFVQTLNLQMSLCLVRKGVKNGTY